MVLSLAHVLDLTTCMHAHVPYLGDLFRKQQQASCVLIRLSCLLSLLSRFAQYSERVMPSLPDEEIFPHATGAAENTVAAHQEPCDLVYHGSWFCPFVQVSMLVGTQIQPP